MERRPVFGAYLWASITSKSGKIELQAQTMGMKNHPLHKKKPPRETLAGLDGGYFLYEIELG